MSDNVKPIRESLDKALGLLNSIRANGVSDDRERYLSETRSRVLDAIGSLESYIASCWVAETPYQVGRRLQEAFANPDQEEQARLDSEPEKPF